MRRRLSSVFQMVLAAIAAVALLLIGIGALLPRQWRVERSIMIYAPPERVHRWAADLAYWSRWAQWDQGSLAPRNELGEPSSGPGATLTWRGRGRSHETTGTVRITQSEPARGVWFEHRVDGGKPTTATLSFEPKPGVTQVTWRDEGELPPIIGGFMLDYFQTRLAEHMGEGLERLEQLVEHPPQDSPAADSPAADSPAAERPK
jgi:hypothetical protein